MKTRYVIISLIVLFVLLSLTLTAEAVSCDPHCVVKGCDKKGCCYKGCHPNWEYRLKGCDCVPRCGGFCLDCISYRICRNCRVGYVVQAQSNGDRICVPAPKKTAIKCDPNCLSPTDCSTANKCNTKCKPDFGFTTTQTCGACDINCLDAADADRLSATGCTKEKQCDKDCKPNYVIDTIPYCQSCDPSCEPAYPPNCVTPGTCLVCMAGYSFSTSTGQCGACATDCLNCTINHANLCDPDGCNTSSVYDTSSQTCAACHPNCAGGCSAPGTCDTFCVPGFNLITDTCAACGDHCTSGCATKGASACDSTCEIGWALDDSTYTGTYQCQPCQDPTVCDNTKDCSSTGPDTCNAGGCIAPAVFDATINVCI